MTDQVDPNAPAPAGETMPNETLFEKAAELIHEAEAKVEALIHPSATPDPNLVIAAPAGPSSDQQPAATADTPTAGSFISPKLAEQSSILDEMEADALFWGGEGMDKIRHHIGRLRQALSL